MTIHSPRQHGFSIVEIMVGVVIGMIAVLVEGLPAATRNRTVSCRRS